MPKSSLPKPKIFISHSAKEPATKKVLDALIKCLKRDFDVLVDKDRLKAGQDFRDEIFSWINRAHGAIILFSSAALTSDWVRAEASFLAARRTLDKSFTLIPVVLKPVTTNHLERKEFSPMQFPSLQLVSSNNLQVICRKVSQGLAGLRRPTPPATPVEKLIEKIAEILRRVSPNKLLSAAQVMGLNVKTWTDSSKYPELLAEQMLERGLLSSGQGIREFDDSLGAEQTDLLIELIAPAWVSLRAAGTIPLIATNEDLLLRRLWVNGGDKRPEFTADHFVRRACVRPPETCWPVLLVQPDAGEDEVGRYKRTIQEHLKNKIVGVEDADELEVARVLANRETSREPIFVAFHPPGPAPDTLTALRKEFGTLTFFILTGNQTTQSNFPPEVEFLEPRLQPGEEADAYAQYLTVRGFRKRTSAN